MWLPRSHAGRLFAAVALAVAVETALSVWHDWRTGLREIEATERRRLTGLAQVLAAQLDGTAHEEMAQRFPAREAVTSWAAAPAPLRRAQALLATAVEAARTETPIYTLRLRDDRRAEVAASPGALHRDAMEFLVTSSISPYWRHGYEYRPEMADALFGGRSASTGLYRDAHGAWLSAYAPVRGADGAPVAILEVDAKQDDVYSLLRAKASRRLGFAAASLLGLLAVLALIVAATSRSLRRLADAATRFGSGDYTTAFPRSGAREVTELAGTLERTRVEIARSMREQAEARALLEAALAEQRLTQQALERALADAQAAARAKADFLATMSHEIRTPMNGVIGMTALLMRTELTAKQRQYSDAVRRSADALLVVIDDILDFSKIEAGKLALADTAFDVRDVVEEVAELLAPRAQQKGLELGCRVSPDVPATLRGDPHRLRQILINLCGNAVKFTDQGEIFVRARLGEDADGSALVRFEVIDTGIGIPPGAQSRLFSAFSQVDASSTRRHGGTGLGLAICRRLAALMGGEVGLRSEPGKGSTFWFTARFSRPACATEAARSRGAAELVGLPVLIVDDNATNREILHELALGWQMRVDCVASGPDALRVMRSRAATGDPYALAILDMQMPEMDGLDLARAIRAEPRLADTRLVILTSMGDDLEVEARAAGVLDFLHKPVREGQLLDCLSRLARVPAEAWPAPTCDAVRAGAAPTIHVVREGAPRILVVEDNPVNQELAVELLQELGYRVDVACNGRSGVERVLGGAYGLVLMDCQMPILDGYEATAEIRRHEPAGKHTPIVAMTAQALAGDREAALAAGMDDYLSKPIDLDALQRVLARFLSAGRSREVLVAPAAPLPPTRAARPNKRAVALFLQHAPAQLAAIDAAMRVSDPVAACREAHKLKGTLAVLDAKPLAALCAEVEAATRKGDLGAATSWLRSLRAGLESLHVELQGALEA